MNQQRWEEKCQNRFISGAIMRYKQNSMSWQEFYERMCYVSDNIGTNRIDWPEGREFGIEFANKLANDGKLFELKVLRDINRNLLPTIPIENKDIKEWLEKVVDFEKAGLSWTDFTGPIPI